MSLLRAERRRLVKRRSTKIMIALAVLIFAGVATTFAFVSHRHDAAAYALADQRAQAEYDRQTGYMRQFVQQCEQAKANGSPDAKNRFPEDCSMMAGPSRDSFQAEWYLPFEFNFSTDFDHMITLFAGVLVLVGFIVGASFIGAEWNSGAMMNLLLWRPRRIPVLLTKLGTLLGGVLAIGVVLSAAWTASFWLIGKYGGTLGKLTPGVWRSFALSGTRALVLSLIFAAAGFALASIGRHTAMALGMAIGVGLASEVGLRIALQLTRLPFGDRWMLSTYAAAWMEKKLTLANYRSCEFSMGECHPQSFVVTWQQAGWLFGIATVVLIAISMWSIQRRDVA